MTIFGPDISSYPNGLDLARLAANYRAQKLAGVS